MINLSNLFEKDCNDFIKSLQEKYNGILDIIYIEGTYVTLFGREHPLNFYPVDYHAKEGDLSLFDEKIAYKRLNGIFKVFCKTVDTLLEKTITKDTRTCFLIFGKPENQDVNSPFFAYLESEDKELPWKSESYFSVVELNKGIVNE